MIVVKIMMWPGGDERRERELQRVLITNIGGTAEVGEYQAIIPKSAAYAKGANVGKVWRSGRVSGFPRLKLGPADLLLRALIACCGDRSRRDVASLGDPNLVPPLSTPETIGSIK